MSAERPTSTYSAMHKKRYKPKIMFEGFKINFFRSFLGAFERASKNDVLIKKKSVTRSLLVFFIK